jgi:hypothetical protein
MAVLYAYYAVMKRVSRIVHNDEKRLGEAMPQQQH